MRVSDKNDPGCRLPGMIHNGPEAAEAAEAAAEAGAKDVRASNSTAPISEKLLRETNLMHRPRDTAAATNHHRWTDDDG